MKLKKFQEGGQVPPQEQEQMAQSQGQQQASPEEQLKAMAVEIINSLGPEASAMLAQLIMQMLQGGQQAQPAAPTYARKGGKLVMLGR